MNSLERICSIDTFSGSSSVNHFTWAFAIIGEKQNTPIKSKKLYFFNVYPSPFVTEHEIYYALRNRRLC